MSHEIDELQQLESAIRAELKELELLSGSTAGDRAPVALDQQSVGRVSRIDAMQGQAQAQASDARRSVRRAALQQALHRMGEGEYGYCADCGEAIATPRLRADPAAALCIHCAQSAER